MPSLGLKYTTYDVTNRLWVYQRIVPAGAIWLIQKKKLYISLGATQHEARTRYLAVHSKWDAAIKRAMQTHKTEPDEDDQTDRIIQFLNAEAARDGGMLREID